MPREAHPFQPTWQSLETYRIPTWYQDAKFGIFIHWGVYSVPAFSNEWYPRRMYLQGTKEYQHHLTTYGPHETFGYKDFIPMFKAEAFDASAWAELFQQAGARYVVPVAEHHDGFPMYDCSYSDWTALNMGPKRDIIGELADAVRKQGLVFGVSSHRAENWWFYNGGKDFASDVQDPRYQGLYGNATPMPNFDNHQRDSQPRPDALFLEDWLARTCELVDKYQPQLIWFDWWINQIVFQPYLQKFAAYYYNRAMTWDKGVAINFKLDTFPEGTAVFDVERGQLTAIQPQFWQTDTSVSKTSWGYVNTHDYKMAGDIIGDLVDIVSKNGALLLNIGPRPDGTIPKPEIDILQGIGKWLKVNGEAIYETRPWRIYGEGPTDVPDGSFTDTKRTPFTGQDIRFTTRNETLYAIALAWPGKEMTIKALARSREQDIKPVANVELLGSDRRLSWKQDQEGLSIELPEEKPCEHAFTFRIVFS